MSKRKAPVVEVASESGVDGEFRRAFEQFGATVDSVAVQAEVLAISSQYRGQEFLRQSINCVDEYTDSGALQVLFDTGVLFRMIQKLYDSNYLNSSHDSSTTDQILLVFEKLLDRCTSEERYEILVTLRLAESLILILCDLQRKDYAKRYLLLLFRYLHVDPEHKLRFIAAPVFDKYVVAYIRDAADGTRFVVAIKILSQLVADEDELDVKQAIAEHQLCEFLLIFLQLNKYNRDTENMLVMIVEFFRDLIDGYGAEILGYDVIVGFFRHLLEVVVSDTFLNSTKYLAIELLTPRLSLFPTSRLAYVESGLRLFNSCPSTEHSWLVVRFVGGLLRLQMEDSAEALNPDLLQRLEHKIGNLVLCHLTCQFTEKIQGNGSMAYALDLLLDANFRQLIEASKPYSEFLVACDVVEYLDLLFKYYEPQAQQIFQYIKQDQFLRQSLTQGISLNSLIPQFFAEKPLYHELVDILVTSLKDNLTVLELCEIDTFKQDLLDDLDDTATFALLCCMLKQQPAYLDEQQKLSIWHNSSRWLALAPFVDSRLLLDRFGVVEAFEFASHNNIALDASFFKACYDKPGVELGYPEIIDGLNDLIKSEGVANVVKMDLFSPLRTHLGDFSRASQLVFTYLNRKLHGTQLQYLVDSLHLQQVFVEALEEEPLGFDNYDLYLKSFDKLTATSISFFTEILVWKLQIVERLLYTVERLPSQEMVSAALLIMWKFVTDFEYFPTSLQTKIINCLVRLLQDVGWQNWHVNDLLFVCLGRMVELDGQYYQVVERLVELAVEHQITGGSADSLEMLWKLVYIGWLSVDVQQKLKVLDIVERLVGSIRTESFGSVIQQYLLQANSMVQYLILASVLELITDAEVLNAEIIRVVVEFLRLDVTYLNNLAVLYKDEENTNWAIAEKIARALSRWESAQAVQPTAQKV